MGELSLRPVDLALAGPGAPPSVHGADAAPSLGALWVSARGGVLHYVTLDDNTLAAASPEQLAQQGSATGPEAYAWLGRKAGMPDLLRVYLALAGVTWMALAATVEANFSSWCALVLAVCAVPAYVFNQHFYKMRIAYDLGSPELVARAALADAVGAALGSVSALWIVADRQRVHDPRYHAGAGSTSRRERSACTRGGGPWLETNLDPCAVQLGGRRLVLLPDCLLLLEGRRLWVFPYQGLHCTWNTTDFIEEEARPPDAEFVRWTWRFVRNDGGPDRRFANNHQLPVMRYGELKLRASDGTELVLYTSRIDAARVAAEHLQRLASWSAPVAPALPAPAVSVPAPAPFGLLPPLVMPPLAAVAVPPPPPLEWPAKLVMPADAALTATHVTLWWQPVAVALKRVALADRKFTQDEVEAIAEMLRARFGAAVAEGAGFEATLRKLEANDEALERALSELSRASLQERQWVFECCQRVAGADGKVTPKEAERIAELRAALGV